MNNSPTSVEATASTVEEAIEKGLGQLGVGPSQVIVEVLEEPSRGLFGLGSKQAKVRLQLLAPPPRKEVSPPPPPAVEVAEEVVEDEPVEDETEPETPVVEIEPMAQEDVEDIAAVEEVDDEDVTITYVERPATDFSAADEDDFFDEDGSYGDDSAFRAAVKEKKPSTPAKRPAQERRPQPRREEKREPAPRDVKDEYRPPREREREDEYRPPSKRERTRGHSETSVVETPPIQFMEDATDLDIAQQVIDELNDIMQLEAHLDVFRAPASDRDGEDGPPWVLNLEGEGDRLTNFISKKGEALSALQYITRLIVSKQTEARANIIIDVNNHRNSRSEKLEKLAHRMADQAVDTNRIVTMEPMPPHERRIIHMVLREREDVETESKGQGDSRRVTIMPKPDPAG